MLITFEGPEGGGKSTQVALLAESLRSQGLIVAQLREPGGTEISEQIRDVLHDNKNKKMDARTELLLYEAARSQMVSEVVIPRLEDDIVVLVDRFRDSSVAYQGGGRGISDVDVNWLNDFTTRGLVPDLTLLLTVDAETGLKRRKSNGKEMNRMDNQSLEFHKKVQKKYLEMAQEGGRWVMIDANGTASEVQEKVRDVVVVRLIESGILEGNISKGKER
ncbi:MAG: dTMP kinase [Patescibacteria group bacterium]